MQLFETERLLVRNFTASDSNDFFLLNSNVDTMRFIRPVKSKAECADFLVENIKLYQENSIIGRQAVYEKESKKFIGTFSFLYLSDNINYHIGYALLPDYWGNGFAQELVKKGISFFFNTTDHEELFAITEAEHTASKKVLIKNGFLLKGNIFEYGKQLDLFYISR